jgi:hypothetical protein
MRIGRTTPTDILLGRKNAKAATLSMLIPAMPVFDNPWPNAANASAAQIHGDK